MNYKAVHICVNYRNNEETKAFLRQLFALDAADSVLFCLVDNSADLAKETDFAEFLTRKNFRLIQAPENLGYFGAAQKAFKDLASLWSQFEWCLVSNTDLSIDDAQFFSKIFVLPSAPKTAVIAPAVISQLSQKDSNPFMHQRPSKARMQFYSLMFSNYFLCQFYQFLGLLKRKIALLKPALGKSSEQEIYAPQGSFIIFNKTYFMNGCDFAHPVFLYCEEIFVAESCRQKGLHVQYKPNIRVIHKEHGSIGLFSAILSPRIYHYRREAAKVCFEKYFS